VVRQSIIVESTWSKAARFMAARKQKKEENEYTFKGTPPVTYFSQQGFTSPKVSTSSQ
jgi:hypothetical protein